ncbi:unnamed protein product [Prunus armeniaca]|uniref:Uncharacterized protein n=1 Tax=Prunus armeniaca TaxID=36596 RepID=A0A6J5UNZ3_PRUAR|nr:unnamed protein product [Prunus armeniaca]
MGEGRNLEERRESCRVHSSLGSVSFFLVPPQQKERVPFVGEQQSTSILGLADVAAPLEAHPSEVKPCVNKPPSPQYNSSFFGWGLHKSIEGFGQAEQFVGVSEAKPSTYMKI